MPERWVEGSPLEASEAQKKAFMPFGDGIRSCVGELGCQSLLFSSEHSPVPCESLGGRV